MASRVDNLETGRPVYELKDLLNEQICMEFQAHDTYLYLACASQQMGLFGFSKFCNVKASEEYAHAKSLMNYMISEMDIVPAHTVFERKITYQYSPAEALNAFYTRAYKEMERLETSVRDHLCLCHEAASNDRKYIGCQDLLEGMIREQDKDITSIKQTLKTISKLDLSGIVLYDMNRV